MCRVCYVPSFYGPSLSCAEFAMRRVVPKSIETPNHSGGTSRPDVKTLLVSLRLKGWDNL